MRFISTFIKGMQKIRTIVLLTFIFMVTACGHQDKSEQMITYFEGGLHNRIKMLDAGGGSREKKRSASEIDKKVNQVILISKDIENLQASVTLGNRCFKDLALEFGLDEKE